MKRALLRSVNLIGDGMHVGAVAKYWYETKGKEFDEIHLQTIPNHAKDIYKCMGIPWKVVFERDSEPYDYEFNFDTTEAWRLSDKKRWSLIRSFGDMMGIDTSKVPLMPNYTPPEMEISDDLKGRVLLSIVSLSDPINKVPKDPKDWLVLFGTLRDAFPEAKFGFLGAVGERVPDELNVPEDEYLLGLPLDQTAHAMRYAKCVLTIDNGMAHLAASQKARQYYLGAWCLHQYYITPWANPNLRLWHFDPFNADINLVNESLKSAIRDWKAADESKITN